MAPSISAILCRYRYDPLDRLASTQSAAQDSALRFYRKNRLATQIQGAIQYSVFGHDDQLLVQQQRSGESTETSLLATDLQGSVLHGVDGAGTGARAYNAYGHYLAESGLSCLMGFNGEQRDPVTGHYLLGNGYRAFNPVLMRFNSPDSLSPFGEGGLNTYAYCQGDPVSFSDPTGHISYGALLMLGRSRHSYSHASQRVLQTQMQLYEMLDAPIRAVQVPSVYRLGTSAGLTSLASELPVPQVRFSAKIAKNLRLKPFSPRVPPSYFKAQKKIKLMHKELEDAVLLRDQARNGTDVEILAQMEVRTETIKSNVLAFIADFNARFKGVRSTQS